MKINKNYIYVYIIIIAATLIRFYQLSEESLWGDEIITINEASVENIYNVWRMTESENNPLLYFLLLFFWFKILIPSVFTLRLFSFIFSVLSLPFFYVLVKKITNEKIGLLSLLLLAFSPFHLWYAQEGRMYSLLVFFEILYLLILIKFVQFQSFSLKGKISYLIIFCLSSLLLFQTHFYSAFIIFFGVIFILVLIFLNKDYSSIKFLISYLLFLFIISSPNLFKIMNRINTGAGIGWIEKLNVGTLKGIILAFTYGVFIPPKSYLLFYSLCSVHLILFIIGVFDYKSAYKFINTNDNSKFLWYLFPILLFLSLIILPISVSIFRPIMFYGQRYLIVATIPYYILISRGLFLLYKKIGKIGKWLSVVFLVIILFGNLHYIIDYFNSRQKRPFDNVVKDVLDPQFTLNSAYIIEPDYLSDCIKYYMKTDYIHLPFEEKQIMEYVQKMSGNQKLWVISIEAEPKKFEDNILKYLKRGKTYLYYNDDIPYMLIRLTEYMPK